MTNVMPICAACEESFAEPDSKYCSGCKVFADYLRAGNGVYLSRNRYSRAFWLITGVLVLLSISAFLWVLLYEFGPSVALWHVK